MKTSKIVLSSLCLLALMVLLLIFGYTQKTEDAFADDDYCITCVSCSGGDFGAACCIGLNTCGASVNGGSVTCDGYKASCGGDDGEGENNTPE